MKLTEGGLEPSIYRVTRLNWFSRVGLEMPSVVWELIETDTKFNSYDQ